MPLFDTTINDRGPFTVIALHGELDLTGTDTALRACRRALTERSPHLILDLSNLTFMDSSGLNVLITARTAVQNRKGTIALAAPTRPVERVLSTTGFTQVFALYPTVEAAAITGAA
ncbi:STAS domain-containing protein [Actinomadura nitritigenes]|uniref:STAS domain-containing protein n=1 Tax=Actinomadura nitritigenes TaxID=134602 RepID=UPI003D8D6A02